MNQQSNVSGCFSLIGKVFIFPLCALGVLWFILQDFIADNAISLVSLVGVMLVLALYVLFFKFNPNISSGDTKKLRLDGGRK